MCNNAACLSVFHCFLLTLSLNCLHLICSVGQPSLSGNKVKDLHLFFPIFHRFSVFYLFFSNFPFFSLFLSDFWHFFLLGGTLPLLPPSGYATAFTYTVFTLGTKSSQAVFEPAVCKYPTTVNQSEIYSLLPKPYSLMRHLVRGNRVRNGRDRRPETRRMSSQKLALLKIPMDSVQYNTEHCGIYDDTDNEHSVQGQQKPPVESESLVLIQSIRACPRGSITAQRLQDFLMEVLVNEFLMFRAFYRCQILLDFHM